MYAGKELVSRSEWGTINFKEAKADIESVLFLATELSNLPLQYLTSVAASELSSSIPPVAEHLSQIDNFSLEVGDPNGRRDSIRGELQSAAESFHTQAHPLIPYLVYRRGDIAENIQNLDEAVNAAQEALHNAEQWVSGKKDDVEEIVNATREAAASAGVATFTAEFDGEASELRTRSKNWLWATAVFALSTILAAILLYFWPQVSVQDSGWETLRNVASKAAIIAVLFTGTVWCGRIYRALTHQATVNRHRALSLKTFQAFASSTDDPIVRDAVLVAATKTVFAGAPTGLVNSSRGQDAGINFVELGRVTKGKVADANVAE